MSVVGLEKFYGRKATLDILRKRVLDFKDGYRQNVALIGERYIGKTFVLHKFLSEMAAPDTLQVYIDVEYKGVDYFCQKMVGMNRCYTKNSKASTARSAVRGLS